MILSVVLRGWSIALAGDRGVRRFPLQYVSPGFQYLREFFEGIDCTVRITMNVCEI